MPKINVPQFVQSIGSRVIAYILNISNEDAEYGLQVSNFDLPKEKLDILDQYIDLCKMHRIKYINNTDINLHMLYYLNRSFIDKIHIFNIWREQSGGDRFAVYHSDDNIVKLLNRLYVELYPLFLVNRTCWNQHSDMILQNIGHAINSLSERKCLYDEIMNDEHIHLIFHTKEKNDLCVHGHYMSSTGRGGSIQLSLLPSMLFLNSYRLMRMRGYFDPKAFSEAAEYTVATLRRCINGETVEVPLLLGFSNISIDDIGKIETNWGIIRPIGESISELVPRNFSITNINDKQYKLGFVLESSYPYKINFTRQYGEIEYPKEISDARKKIDELTENISLCFSLACKRNPPVSISLAWEMIFDPISHGTQVSWFSNSRTATIHFILKENQEKEELVTWCNRIKNIDDKNIRLAIRRVLSAINKRTNPVDSFIDTVVAWENLFGTKEKIGSSISGSIANLLEGTRKQLKEIKTKVNNYYKIRCDIVHGSKEITTKDAREYRDDCLDITLKVMRKLYIEKPALLQLDSSKRSDILLKVCQEK